MLDFYIFDRSLARKASDDEPFKSACLACDIPDGMPIFVSSEGYCHDINGFFRQLPHDDCGSPRSWKAYANDLRGFGNFLAKERGKALLEADQEDLKAYHKTRRVNGRTVIAETWNRNLSGIDKFYKWSVRTDLLDEFPFESRDGLVRQRGRTIQVSVNALHAKVGGREDVRCVSRSDYIFFRDVGLKGQLPDGKDDPKYRPRNPQRNAALADFLVTTGVRLTEGISVLVPELPRFVSGATANTHFNLAHSTCKRGGGRVVHLAHRVLKDIEFYRDEERASAVMRLRARGELEQTYPDRAEFDARGARIDGRRRDFGDLKPEERRCIRMGADDVAEPALLWCNEIGHPLRDAAVEKVFEEAGERCQKYRPGLWVSPHTLRHTFAVQMLNLLLREAFKSVVELRALKQSTSEDVYSRLLMDPLSKLKALLGHKKVETTYKYLTYLETADEMVDRALSSWADEISLPSPGGGA